MPSKPKTAHVALQAVEMVLMWGGFLALQIAKTRFNRCSGAYGGLFAAEIVLAVGASAFFAWQARRSKLVAPFFRSFALLFPAGSAWQRRPAFSYVSPLPALWPCWGSGSAETRVPGGCRPQTRA